MKRLLRYLTFVAGVCAVVMCLHGKAYAAASCKMNQTSLVDLIANYDPPRSATTTAMTVNGGTLSFTCSGLGSGNASHVYVLLNGNTSFASYVAPFLTGPNGFQLTYKPCIPGTGTCNGSTNLWGNTAAAAYKTTSGVNGVNTISPATSVFLGAQDAYVGDTSKYSGLLYFDFLCGEGGNQSDCTGT